MIAGPADRIPTCSLHTVRTNLVNKFSISYRILERMRNRYTQRKVLLNVLRAREELVGDREVMWLEREGEEGSEGKFKSLGTLSHLVRREIILSAPVGHSIPIIFPLSKINVI